MSILLARRVRPAQPFGFGLDDASDPVLTGLITAFSPQSDPDDCPCWNDPGHIAAGTACGRCDDSVPSIQPVHMAPDSFASPAERQRAADRVSAIVGAGDARRAILSRRPGLSPVDLAYSHGLSVALACDGPVDAPRHYSAEEQDGFLSGLREGSEIAHAREIAHLDDIEAATAGNYFGHD